MKLAFQHLPIAALLACALLTSASAQGLKPVEVGGNAELDACGSLGQIVGLDPRGDNFLSVREGPGPRDEERDRPGAGALVAICNVRQRSRTFPHCGIRSRSAAVRGSFRMVRFRAGSDQSRLDREQAKGRP